MWWWCQSNRYTNNAQCAKSSKNGADKKIKNPFGYVKDSFYDRPLGTKDRGGSISLSKYFSDEQASPFYGISYLYNKNLLLKFEKDPILVNGPRMPYEQRESEFSFGLDYFFNNNFSLGVSFERGGFFSMKFVYKNNPKSTKK